MMTIVKVEYRGKELSFSQEDSDDAKLLTLLETRYIKMKENYVRLSSEDVQMEFEFVSKEVLDE